MLAYHFFSVAFYSIYILFVHGVPPQQGQPSKAPGVLEWPYTTYLAFRVVSYFFLSYRSADKLKLPVLHRLCGLFAAHLDRNPALGYKAVRLPLRLCRGRIDLQ